MDVPFALHMTTLSATGFDVDFDSSRVESSIPAGHLSKTVEIQTHSDDRVEDDAGEQFRIDLLSPGSGVRVGTPSTAYVNIEEQPRLVISQRELVTAEDSRCGADEKGGLVFGRFPRNREGNSGSAVWEFGSAYTTVEFTVRLAEAPRAGRYVHVGVWDPSSIHRWPNHSYFYSSTTLRVYDSAGRRLSNSRGGYLHRIMTRHGYRSPELWTAGMQRKISLNEAARSYVPLDFTDGNWNVPQTVQVKVHCDDHSAVADLPVFLTAASIKTDDGVRAHEGAQFVLFRNPLIWRNMSGRAVSGAPSNNQVHYSAWIPERTSVDVVNVRVADSTAPASQASYSGTLEPSVGWVGSGQLGWELEWKNPTHNSADARANFAAMRVTVRTVAPAGHPDQVFFRPFAGPGHPSPWEGYARLSGSVRRSTDTLTYEISAVPVDHRGKEVASERVSICRNIETRVVNLTRYVDTAASPVCPPPAPSADSQSDGTVDAVPPAAVDTTATGHDSQPECTPQLPADAVAKARAAFDWHVSHGSQSALFWRILNTFGADDLPARPSAVTETTVTAQEVRDYSDGKGWAGWSPIVDGLDAVEQCAEVPDADPEPVVDPEPDPVVSVAGGPGVSEGGDAVFTVTASPAPSSPLSVDVSVAQLGDYGAATGSRTVTVPTGGSATLTVATADDSVDEADGSVTVTVSSGADYDVSSTAGAATVAVSDDDDPPPPNAKPSLSISDVTAGEGDTAVFTVTLSPSSSRYVWVSYYTLPGGYGQAGFSDFAAAYGTLTFKPGDTAKPITVALTDDQQSEGSETFKVLLYNAAQASISDGEAIGTITDND